MSNNIACGFIGKKIGMTRIPDGDALSAVTIISFEEQKITAVRTTQKDGYDAVQVGYYPKKAMLLRKPDVGRLRKAGLEDNFSRFKEFKTTTTPDADCIGNPLTIDMLENIKVLDVQGIVKGRGYQGAIKRWGFQRGRETHGSRFHRRPGSLGVRTAPGRVFKNKKMPGQMGNVKRTTQNMRVLAIDKEQRVIAVRGAVPGSSGSYIVLRPAAKHSIRA